MSGEKRIKVACRVRPKMEKMGERYELEVAKKADEHSLIITQPAEDANDKPKQSVFSFDYVFDESDTQRDIYEESALELVDSCLDGCNSTIFTYGQTGSGKTFTILGDVDERSETLIKPSSGLFIRSLTDLFNYKERAKRTIDCKITLSILEIYNEELRDLLNKKTKLQMREIDDEVQLPNLTTVEVSTLTDVYKYFKIANGERAVTATKSNEESSRSHAVFLVDLYQTPRQADHNPLADGMAHQEVTRDLKPTKCSRLSLVDLAGSERVKKSGVEGKGMLEAQAINKSLSCLGNVVNAMYLDTKHIPYRDSKLTRLLRTSFVDPSSKVMLITNLSPTANSFSESLSSLRFADRVKGLKAGNVSFLDPVVEQEYLAKLKQAEELGADLRIAQCAVDYRPQRTRRKFAGGDLKVYLKQCIAEYQQQVQQEEENKRRKEEQELHNMIQSETTQVVEAWKKRIVDMEQQLATAVTDQERLQYEVEHIKADKEREIEDKMNEAKRRKKDRKTAEERLEKVTAELEQSAAEEKRLTKETKRLEKQFMEQEGQREEQWAKDCETWDVLDARHERAATFVEKLKGYHAAQLRYYAERLENQPLVNHVRAIKYEIAYCEVADVIDNALDVIVSAAVGEGRRPLGAVRTSAPGLGLPSGGSLRNRPELASKPHGVSPPPEPDDSEGSDDDDEGQGEIYDPGIKARSQQNTAVQNGRAQVAFHNTTSATAPYDEEEADRQYLMGIYDADGLVEDIIKYLQSGTILLKHGRNGKPHFRKFWVSDDRRELCWMDPEQPKGRRSSIDLGQVVDVVMGQYSKVFRRNHANLTEPEFYLSFSLMLRNKRTLDVVAETASEFEAWLMGLSHILQRDPHWGRPLDISAEEGHAQLRPRDQECCSEHHVTPTLFNKLKELVNGRRDEVNQSIRLFDGDMEKVYTAVGGIHPPAINEKGALLMTKGELRYLANVDIFRTCVIWRLFNNQNLIYDPKYRPPTPNRSGYF